MIGGLTQTGNLLGDLITGQMANVQRINTLNDPLYSTKEPNVYVQDDWRVKRWLTLNSGLWFDVFTPLTERYGQFANFDSGTGLLISPSLPGAQKSGPTAGVKTDYGDLAPVSALRRLWDTPRASHAETPRTRKLFEKNGRHRKALVFENNRSTAEDRWRSCAYRT
jgi:hypothetical protein